MAAMKTYGLGLEFLSPLMRRNEKVVKVLGKISERHTPSITVLGGGFRCMFIYVQALLEMIDPRLIFAGTCPSDTGRASGEEYQIVR